MSRTVYLISDLPFKIPDLALKRMRGADWKRFIRLYKFLFDGNSKLKGFRKYSLSIKALYYDLRIGWKENFFEGIYWILSKNPLLVPTWFSFFAVINVQPKAELVTEEEHNMIWRVVMEITGDDWCRDHHCFEGPSNWVKLKGKFKLLDYASRGSLYVVDIYGKQIYEAINKNTP